MVYSSVRSVDLCKRTVCLLCVQLPAGRVTDLAVLKYLDNMLLVFL